MKISCSQNKNTVTWLAQKCNSLILIRLISLCTSSPQQSSLSIHIQLQPTLENTTPFKWFLPHYAIKTAKSTAAKCSQMLFHNEPQRDFNEVSTYLLSRLIPSKTCHNLIYLSCLMTKITVNLAFSRKKSSAFCVITLVPWQRVGIVQITAVVKL